MRWNDLSESMKNIAFVNQLKNKLGNRMHSIITFTFRGTGVKMRTDANKITEGHANRNART